MDLIAALAQISEQEAVNNWQSELGDMKPKMNRRYDWTTAKLLRYLEEAHRVIDMP